MLFTETKHDKPQVGKTVELMEICPEFERKNTPFASLLKDGCLNCEFAESRKKENYEYSWTYICAYPKRQNGNQTEKQTE